MFAVPNGASAKGGTSQPALRALVVRPATDLYLAGHGEPGTRSLAPLERARAAGGLVHTLAMPPNRLNTKTFGETP